MTRRWALTRAPTREPMCFTQVIFVVVGMALTTVCSGCVLSPMEANREREQGRGGPGKGGQVASSKAERTDAPNSQGGADALESKPSEVHPSMGGSVAVSSERGGEAGGTRSAGGTSSLNSIVGNGGSSGTAKYSSIAAGGTVAQTGGASIGSSVPKSACDLSLPFSKVLRAIDGSETQVEDGISVSADGLSGIASIKDASSSSSSFDLKLCKRNQTDEPFDCSFAVPTFGAEPETGVAWPNASEYCPRLTRDGLSLYFTRYVPVPGGGAGPKIYVATWDKAKEAFSQFAYLDNAVVNMWDDTGFQRGSSCPWIDSAHQSIYWSWGDGVYLATIANSGFSNKQYVQNVTPFLSEKVSPTSEELQPAAGIAPTEYVVLTDDQLTMYLASTDGANDKGAPTGNPRSDHVRIWRTQRNQVAARWSTPTLLRALDSADTLIASQANCYPNDLSPDGCILYVSCGPHVYQLERSE